MGLCAAERRGDQSVRDVAQVADQSGSYECHRGQWRGRRGGVGITRLQSDHQEDRRESVSLRMGKTPLGPQEDHQDADHQHQRSPGVAAMGVGFGAFESDATRRGGHRDHRRGVFLGA